MKKLIKSKIFMKILGVCGAQGALLSPFKKFLIGNVEPRAQFHTEFEEQWVLNFGKIPFLRNLDGINEIPDIIIGSPSCGHSSIFSYSRKKTLGNPKKDDTLNLYLTSIVKFEPKFFLMENLPKLLDLIPLEEWHKTLKNYHIITHCHSVSDLGNSQVSRIRLIMVGIRKDYKPLNKYFDSLFPVCEKKNCLELYKQVNHSINYKEPDDKVLAMYYYKDPNKQNLTVKQVKELWNTEFKDEYKWPIRSKKMNTLPGVYRNRKYGYPMTLRPSNRQFNYLGEVIGLDECRIIMGFPKEFKIHMNTNRLIYWLNKGRNTLTKGATFEVGIWFKTCLENLLGFSLKNIKS